MSIVSHHHLSQIILDQSPNEISIGAQSGNLWGAIAVLLGLALFGVLYNSLVERAKKVGWLEPYTALWVAAGVAVTLIGLAILDVLMPTVNAGLLALLAFAASGVPMILGDASRYVSSVQSNINAMRNGGRDGD